jgi:hypothetical protein
MKSNSMFKSLGLVFALTLFALSIPLNMSTKSSNNDGKVLTSPSPSQGCPVWPCEPTSQPLPPHIIR